MHLNRIGKKSIQLCDTEVKNSYIVNMFMLML